jgi:hypothetical protein
MFKKVLNFSIGKVTREEQVKLHLKFKPANIDKDLLKKIDKLFGVFGSSDADSTEIYYNLGIEYFGVCTEKIETIIELIDSKAVMVDMDIEEVKHGRILVKELFDRLTMLEKALKGRE